MSRPHVYFAKFSGPLLPLMGWRRSGMLFALLAILSETCGKLAVNAAELSFESPTANFTAPVEATSQDVAFEFTNASSNGITILEVINGCGCITSALEKRTYAPGEKGRLSVHVEFQDRSGPIKKIVRLRVKGDMDEKETEQRLKIEGIALSSVKVSSLTVAWGIGDSPSTKEILVSTKDGFPISDLKIENTSLSPHFAVETVSQSNGGLLLRITPVVSPEGKVALVDGHELQQPYLLTYTCLPAKVHKKERIYAIIYRQ
jgi:hypothetical protein